MEDRITPGLYLELVHAGGAQYVDARLHEVLARPGVERGSWWDNVVPNRTDLVRFTIAEFPLLALYETTADFVPPAGADGITSLLFRHYPRPGQGSLSGRPTIGLSLVLISPRDEADAQALRDWGDFVHIRHIADASVPGYTMITPYENAAGPGSRPRFCHLYEMDTTTPEASYKAMTPLVAQRLGGTESDGFRQWARHPALKIEYVNTFSQIGASPRSGASPS